MQSIANPSAGRRLQQIHLDALPSDEPSVGPSALGTRFHRQHLWLPVTAFVGLSILLMGLHGDQWLADRVYAVEGHAWALQSDYVIQDVFHAGGRQASKVGWYVVLLFFAASLLMRPMARWRRPLLYLLLSTLLATALVGWMKRWTHMDCPWDLVRYGGQKAYYGLFAQRPLGLGSAGCFPAGHASAGYAWVALYFFFRATSPGWKWWGFGFALGLGMTFGIAQQLRGAHFLSHDVWALMICWLTALALYRLMLAPFPRALPAGMAS